MKTETVEQAFVRDVVTLIDKEIVHTTDFLVSCVQDPPIYAEKIGFLHGLKQAREIVHDILNAYYPRD